MRRSLSLELMQASLTKLFIILYAQSVNSLAIHQEFTHTILKVACKCGLVCSIYQLLYHHPQRMATGAKGYLETILVIILVPRAWL